MFSQLLVQWNCIIYFHIRGSFLTAFCPSFWKRLHNSKEIVNLQGLFVSTVSYYISITILLKGYILFIGSLYYLSIHFYSCCFYIRYPGEITSMPV